MEVLETRLARIERLKKFTYKSQPAFRGPLIVMKIFLNLNYQDFNSVLLIIGVR